MEYLLKILSKEWKSEASNASDVVVSIRCHLSWYDLRFWRCATTPNLIWLASLSKHSSLTPQYSSLMASALFFLFKDTKFNIWFLFRESELRTTNKVDAQLSLSWSGKFLNFILTRICRDNNIERMCRTIVLMLPLCIVTDLQVEIQDLTESCEVPRSR